MNKKLKLYINSLLIILFFTLLYISIALYIGNFDLVNNTLIQNYPFIYKYKIIKGIYTSLFYSYTLFQSATLIIIAVLTAFNILLITKKISVLLASGKLKIIFGGSMILGMASSSCAVCGLPLLAFLGLGGSIAFLPLEGEEFSLITIILLVISTIIIIRNNKKILSCYNVFHE